MKPLPVLLFTLSLLLAVGACTPPAGNAVTAAPTPTVPAPTRDLQLELIYEQWEESPHADTYALEKGPNTYCARCHSPANWDAAATIDEPPNCVSCKFSFEDEPRRAEGNPLVPEDDWASIGCEVCHRVEDGVVQPELAWHNRQTGYYESVADSTELCSHCHRDTETLRHARNVDDSAHADFTCTDCHNAHVATASCGENGCHSSVPRPLPELIAEHEDQEDVSECNDCHSPADVHMGILDYVPVGCMDCHGAHFSAVGRPLLEQGHSEAHVNVACVACHDAVGFELGPVEDQDLWMPFRTTELLERTTTEPYQSHRVAKAVDCTRCHFAGNSWGLQPQEAGADE